MKLKMKKYVVTEQQLTRMARNFYRYGVEDALGLTDLERETLTIKDIPGLSKGRTKATKIMADTLKDLPEIDYNSVDSLIGEKW